MSAKELLPPDLANEPATDSLLEFTLQLEEAARMLDLEPWIVQRLKHCQREITVNIGLRREDGEAANYAGFRLQHCDARGPFLGPVLFSPELHVNTLRARALASSVQYALLNLPRGGSAGAVICDTRKISESDLRAVVREYVFGLRETMGVASDVLVCGEEHIAAWMWDSYVRACAHPEAGAIVGKPAALGGLPPGHAAASVAVPAIASELIGADWEGRGISVQGFGQEARALARWLVNAGARIVALADISGGLMNEQGLDLTAVEEHARREGIVFGFPEAEAVRNTDVLAAKCDMLVLAAAERQVTAANAGSVEAQLIVELAHGGVTPSADHRLRNRNRVVLPESLATCGAVVTAFLESRGTWGVEEGGLRDLVHSAALRALSAAQEFSARFETDLRMGARLAGVEGLAAAVRATR